MHRIRDHLGRFLPHNNQDELFNIFYLEPEEPQFEKKEEPFENPFVDAPEQLPSSDESLHFNGFFAKLEY